jgi:hypothetical protein
MIRVTMKTFVLSVAAITAFSAGMRQTQAETVDSGSIGTGGSFGAPVGDPPILFTYSDGTNSATGVLSSDDLGGGMYHVTGGSLRNSNKTQLCTIGHLC